MTHAIEHEPVNIVRLRRESRIVLGNAGVVRVLRTGDAVSSVREGDVCLFMGSAVRDEFGYTTAVHGYDARHTVGLLAHRSKCAANMVLPLQLDTHFTLQQWAAFSLRYMTAWSNWKVALGAFRLQSSESEIPRPNVWGWGGGSTLAELALACRMGCDVFMVSGSDAHLEEIQRAGVVAVDRREFPDLHHDPERFEADAGYRAAYLKSERGFLRFVRQKTGGRGASVVIDYIGSPVYRASLRALGRQGVITTAGWKHGTRLVTNRANECLQRHIHVFTHAARDGEAEPAVRFAEQTGWMPEVTAEYSWEDVPRLAIEFAAGRVDSYFPVFHVNPV